MPDGAPSPAEQIVLATQPDPAAQVLPVVRECARQARTVTDYREALARAALRGELDAAWGPGVYR